ncbi:chaoptin-like [Contarinia nasturtii]|uniref:chaoptin-like n=1 Tax=Contarinia nasturtii TaxID=265458 RepID=UPI0012D45848|nr:chaoptin-like [Contarinia nasturtii]
MAIKLFFILPLLLYIKTGVCLDKITGCQSMGVFGYSRVLLSCDTLINCEINNRNNKNDFLMYHNFEDDYDYDSGERRRYSHRSNTCECYNQMFTNGNNASVKVLYPCFGSRLDATIPGLFQNIENYDISHKGIELLTSDDLNFKSLVALRAFSNNICNISGSIFSRAPNLTAIDFSYNNISVLYRNDFKGAPQIIKMDFSSNRISSLENEIFMDLPNLTDINFANNRINELHKNIFSGAAQLITINFSKNNISFMELGIFVDCHNLTKIDLSYNQIFTLDRDMFSTVADLRTLSLYGNRIEVIYSDTFKNNKLLRSLNVGANPIHSINENVLAPLAEGANVQIPCDFESFDSSSLKNYMINDEHVMESFFIMHKILYCPLMKTKNLKYLNISENQMRDTTFVMSFLSSTMEVLDLSSNSVKQINWDLFGTCVNLKYVNLRNSSLVSINFDAFRPLLSVHRKLEVIRLGENPFKRLDANVFLFAMNSVEVHLSCSHVEEIDTSCLGKLLTIELTDDDMVIFHIPGDKLKLICAKNRFKYLKYLNISGNQLQNGPQLMEWLGDSIETLDMSSNFVGKLSARTFERFNKLRYLNVSNTQLSNFTFATFYHLDKLRSLDISFNHLKHLDFTLLFRNFRELWTLNLEGNDLNNIDTISLVHFPKLISLGISKNNFSCDYLAKFLLPWPNLHLMHNPSNQTHINGVDCLHIETQGISVDNSTKLQPKRTTEVPAIESTSSKVLSHTSTTQKTIEPNEDKPNTRFECVNFSMIMDSETVDISCDNLEKIDTSCMGNQLQITLDDKDVVFHLTDTNSTLSCSNDQFQKLRYLNISGNHLQNASQLIQLLGTNIETLDVSSIFVGALDEHLLEKFTNLKYLRLSNTNLTNFGFGTFYHQRKLRALDLSFNHLQNIDFTLLMRNFKELTTLNVEANDLNEIDSVTRKNFPQLRLLGISKNNFSCKYLSKFLSQWDNDLHLMYNPSNKTNIDGVDCSHEDEKVRNVAEVDANESANLSQKNSTFPKDDMRSDNEQHKVMTATSLNILGELQTLKYLFVVVTILVVLFGGTYWIFKTKTLQRMKRNMVWSSSDTNVNQQQHGSNNTSFMELSQIQ